MHNRLAMSHHNIRFLGGIDDGTHILPNRHIQSIEPVFTSAEVPSRFSSLCQKCLCYDFKSGISIYGLYANEDTQAHDL